MAENPDDRTGDNEATRPDAAKPNETERENKIVISNLPMVVSPKLGAGDEEVEESVAASTAPAAPAAAPHSTRFVVLAASVAFAAAFGSFVGSVSGSGLSRYFYPGAAPASSIETTTDAMREMKLQLAELSSLKVSLDNAAHNTTSQFAKIADRLDRLDTHGTAAPETTASIATPSSLAPSVPAPAAQPPAVTKLTDRILPGWVVDDVRNGRALIESRYGAMFDVGAGSVLPGLGHVATIKRQDGQWIVLTERGIITSGR